MPSSAFSHVHVDFVEPLSPSRGFSYLLTAVDRSSWWPEAFPLTGISTGECACTFALGWVSRFGVLLDITSDCGHQFTSSIWSHLATSLGSKMHHTTCYHPQSNGLVESFLRDLKSTLRARLLSSDWISDLPWVLLSLHTTPKQDLGYSPAECTLSHQPLLPGSTIRLPAPLDPAISCLPSHHCSPHQSQPYPDLLHATHVFIMTDSSRPTLQPLYAGPFCVLARNTNTFTVDLAGHSEVVSLDRLKPAVLPPSEWTPFSTSMLYGCSI